MGLPLSGRNKVAEVSRLKALPVAQRRDASATLPLRSPGNVPCPSKGVFRAIAFQAVTWPRVRLVDQRGAEFIPHLSQRDLSRSLRFNLLHKGPSAQRQGLCHFSHSRK